MSDFTIIDDNGKSRDEFGRAIYEISIEDLVALLDGKMLYTTINFGDEYIFIRLNREAKTNDRFSEI